MFLRTKERFEALMAIVDDILAADPDPEPAHPHNRAVSLRIERRGGSVAPREMHCLCPVRPRPGTRVAHARRQLTHHPSAGDTPPDQHKVRNWRNECSS